MYLSMIHTFIFPLRPAHQVVPQGIATAGPGRGFGAGDRVGLLLDLDEAKMVLVAAGPAAPPAVVAAVFITPGAAMVTMPLPTRKEFQESCRMHVASFLSRPFP